MHIHSLLIRVPHQQKLTCTIINIAVLIIFIIKLKTEGVLIESMDACFGLSRKKAQGEGVGMPKHQNGFFADQDDVDNFVNNYNETAGASHVDHVSVIICRTWC